MIINQCTDHQRKIKASTFTEEVNSEKVGDD